LRDALEVHAKLRFDAKGFLGRLICASFNVPSRLPEGWSRAQDLQSDKNIPPAVFQVVAIGCHTRMGSCRRVRSAPAGYRETSPVILSRRMPISSLNTTPLTGGTLGTVDAISTRAECSRGVNKAPPAHREVSMSPSASCKMNTRSRREASSNQPAVIHGAQIKNTTKS
jgi:hypothetical protein